MTRVAQSPTCKRDFVHRVFLLFIWLFPSLSLLTLNPHRSNQSGLIPTEIIPSVKASKLSTRQVSAEFDRLLHDGAEFSSSGKAARRPSVLVKRGLKPKHKIELFDTVFYLTNVLQIPELRFFVGYVCQVLNGNPIIFPRIIYKDLSLAWRSASHFTIIDGSIWVGKGDVRIDQEDGFEKLETIEATTDLPVEMQTAVESLLGKTSRAANGSGILELVLRKGPADRVEPYTDFTKPRQRAQANTANLINRGRSVARFKRPGDPRSLTIIKGFEPDFENGIVERGKSRSKLYGGRLLRYRIISTNRKIQYYFVSGARHTWVYPAQSTTTDLSPFGVRTIDVVADDDLFIPGYEYHHFEETNTGQELYSQIPAGYAGEVCPADDAKADASPWLDQLPIIKAFRDLVR